MNQPRHDIELRGCAPTPLAHYLKALGILRLVAEQADSSAQGWWEYDTFWLRSTLDEAALVKFFLEQYSPTPLVGPWGARSGFFPSSSERAAREALDKIASSSIERLFPFRAAIIQVRRILNELGLSEKADSHEEKLMLLRSCRAQLDDNVLPWLDAVYVLSNKDRVFPPLLGTGGNEGSGSYMSGFAQQIAGVILDRLSDHALKPALFENVSSGNFEKQTPGHFFPDAAGGPNSGSGFDGSTGTNPWDYLLALEGSLLFAAACGKKLEDRSDGSLAFPFCVRMSGVGYASADLSDEKPSREEMWFPMWSNRAMVCELKALFHEGRATLNRRNVASGIDLARSIASIGIDRGITRFERFAFQQRNGQSNFAVPLGKFSVHANPGVEELLAPLDGWLERFRRAATGKLAPARAGRVLRQLESAILQLCQRGDANDVQTLLIALGEAEAAIAVSKALREGDKGAGIAPAPLLASNWLVKSCDGSIEFRLAAALASVTHKSVGPFRRHLEPIDLDRITGNEPRAQWAENDTNPAIVWGSGDLVRNLNAVLSRRLIEIMKEGKESRDAELYAPLNGKCFVSLGDITAFIRREVDDRKIEALARGLMLLNWSKVSREDRSHLRGHQEPIPDATYALLKLCHLPYSLESLSVKLSPQIARRALAGDAAGATQLAARRLLASGFPPAVNQTNCSRQHILRTTAALMFPVSRTATRKLAESMIARHKESQLGPETEQDDAVLS